MKCKICNNLMDKFDKAKVLNKYDVQYYRCLDCGFICTEEPYWLDEAYSSAIASTDIGLIMRNMFFSDKVSAILKTILKSLPNAQMCALDYGAGYGMFVRMMRDYGFNFYWYDKYCENLFAKTFESKYEHYDILTAFELFEHLSNPYADSDKIVKLSDSIIFSTELVPDVKD